MVTGIILIIMGVIWGLMTVGAPDSVTTAVIVGPYAAMVAGIGLIIQSRRIAKLKREKEELELARARRIVRQELEKENE